MGSCRITALVINADKQLLDEALKEGCVKMRCIVCITIGLPGVGKTCLKLLLMGHPPPELRTSTICAESPLRIEIHAVSETKIRASGEQWIEVTDELMLEIVASMIMMVSKDHGAFQRGTKPGTKVESPTTKVTRESPLVKFVRWVTKRKSRSTPSPPAKPSCEATAACRKSIAVVMDRLMQIIHRLRSEQQESSSDQIVLSNSRVPISDWVYFSDCGGQPEYHELLPLFVRHISAALCVLRLPDKLDEVQAIEYYSQNKRVGVSLRSQLSAKDTVLCLVNTIQSFSTEVKKPKIILVGTHVDVLEDKIRQVCSRSTSAEEKNKIETLEDKDKKLLEMLTPEFRDQLVYSSSDMNRLLFPLNTINPGDKEQVVATSIRKAIETSPAKIDDVPIWWYILELLLQELAKQLKRGVLSKLECLEMASMLGFREKDFEVALKFFDKLNVIKYSPEVLPNVVFINSQVPLEKVSELIRKSYLLRGDTSTEPSHSINPVEGKWIHFRDHGVITYELMREFPQHYVPDLFTEESLSELLKMLLVFAPIPTPSWVSSPSESQPNTCPQPATSDTDTLHNKASQHHSSKEESDETRSEVYFVMPASLDTLSEAELDDHRISTPIAAPLLVQFSSRSRHAGVFCCFVVHLIRHCGWGLLLDAGERLRRNCIKFQLMTSPPCTVAVIDSKSFIEVHVHITSQASGKECAHLLPILKESINGGITGACRALNYQETKAEVAFFCPHRFSADETDHKLHSAKITRDRKYWRCNLDTRITGLLEPHHLIWFGIDPKIDVSDCPSSASPSLSFQVLDSVPVSVDSTSMTTTSAGGAYSAATTTATVSAGVSVTSRTTNATVGETALQDTPLSAGAYTGVNIPTTISAVHTQITWLLPTTSAEVNTQNSMTHLQQIPRYVPISTGESHLGDTCNISTDNPNPPSSVSAPPLGSISSHLQRKPALHELDMLQGEQKTVRVIARVAPIWERFATRLHFEFHDIMRIEKDCHFQSLTSSQRMIMEWLNGKGRQPTTWATLINALKECELSEVARDIEAILTDVNS